MIQGFDPRTAEPVGEPVAETTDAEVDAIVAAALAAAPAWGAGTALAQRQQHWQPPAAKFERGYGTLYSEHITQANEGCDFDFLARRGRNPEPNPK